MGSGEVKDLFVRLQGKVVGSVGEDKMVLMNLNNNKFFVKFFYMLLWNQGVWFHFQSRLFGICGSPPLLNFFVWEASWGKVLTLD